MDSSTTTTAVSAAIGSAAQLRAQGQLTGKVGDHPVVVFYDGGVLWAIEDRCPHMGFPLHRGTVDDGLLTCHWHHARFDLGSGCTLDLWADDAVAFDAFVEDDEVRVVARPVGDQVTRAERRLIEGLENGLTLVTAKAVHHLLAQGVAPARIVELGLRFAAERRPDGWGPGMTVAQVVLALLRYMPADEHGRALTQGLAFLARDAQGRTARVAVTPLDEHGDADQLARWYRRFVESRQGQAAERVVATGAALDAAATERMLFAAATDHVYVDEGHVIDYVNKACEAAAAIGGAANAIWLFPTLVAPTAAATRHEEVAQWREPVDLLPLIAEASARIVNATPTGDVLSNADVSQLGWDLLSEDAIAVADALVKAAERGATREQLARAVAFTAALRLVRFHVQNDVGDWDAVHHTFTTANAVHQAVTRTPTDELVRGIVHSAFSVYLDRFLNVPAARLPGDEPRELRELEACWDQRGEVDAAGRVVAGHLAAGGSGDAVLGELCRALFREDAGFHWYQSVEAAAGQYRAWPAGSVEAGLILVGATRWLAAHTPTIRQSDQTISIARRLLRGDALYEDQD
jgi:nitrite reductase/ring-hydroxylating ferredoxin subunit